MQIVGMMTVRDEEDIVEEASLAAIAAYDRILAVDCGSTDRTANIMQKLASANESYHFLGSIGPMTPEQVKRHIWSGFRRQLSWGDWWGFADADEFVDRDDLRSVLEYAARRGHDHVNGEHVNFYYTEEDHAKWLSGEETIEDRAQPIAERRKYYRYNTHQIRLFRNLPWLRWNTDYAYPSFLSAPCDRRVVFRHYQYRDPPQIERRIEIRRAEYHRSHASNTHWLKDRLEDAISPADDPNLRLWTGGPFVRDTSLTNMRPQPVWKTALKYTRNIMQGVVTRRQEETWFNDDSW